MGKKRGSYIKHFSYEEKCFAVKKYLEEDADVKELSANISHSSDKIAMGLIIAALIVGSALILQTERIKWVAVFGFIMATILSIILTTSILKER